MTRDADRTNDLPQRLQDAIALVVNIVGERELINGLAVAAFWVGKAEATREASGISHSAAQLLLNQARGEA